MDHCKRSNGTYRAWFKSREEAEAFAKDPVNHPVYLNDVAHLCAKCGFYHLSKPKWLEPRFNEQDREFLSKVGIDLNDFSCVVCGGKQFEPGVWFLMLPDGTVLHEACLPRRTR